MFFGSENKEKYPFFKKYFKRQVDLLLINEEVKNTMFLSKILIHLCIVIHYIVANISVALFAST